MQTCKAGLSSKNLPHSFQQKCAVHTVVCEGCQRDRAELIVGTEEFKSQRWDHPFLASLVRGGFLEELEKPGLGKGSGRGE